MDEVIPPNVNGFGQSTHRKPEPGTGARRLHAVRRIRYAILNVTFVTIEYPTQKWYIPNISLGEEKDSSRTSPNIVVPNHQFNAVPKTQDEGETI